ncbi:MAG: DUF1566 domain-containing protein [Chitinophagaceae bacterium]|nr:MAG: DUF1566 domain-containing protein [Chitinophagaceae bacterium]
MKNHFIILFLISLFFVLDLSANAPYQMSYQAVIRDQHNALITNSQIGVKVSVLQGSETGVAVYTETHTTTTNANGLMTIRIGNGMPVMGTFENINWSDGPYFLQTETDINGGTNYSITALNQLLSVPYALYALESGTPGPEGPAGQDGVPGQDGTPGEDGVSVTGASVTNGELILTLSNQQTINAGQVTGPQGPQGPAGQNGSPGNDGVSVTNASIVNNELVITLSNSQVINVGNVVGPAGPAGQDGAQGPAGQDGQDGIQGPAGQDGTDGTGINEIFMVGDSLLIVLTSGDTLNAGSLPSTGQGQALQAGSTPGDLLIWDGQDWSLIPVGSPGQSFQIGTNGLPQWAGGGYATVITDSVNNITPIAATVFAEITADGGSAITERGFVYSTSPAPNLTDSVVVSGSGTGNFSETLSGLEIGQTYFVRAYATNDAGTVFGNQISFQTLSTFTLGSIGPAGGFIFYDKGEYSDGWRYMEAAPTDQSTGINWGCSGTLIPGSLPSAIGFGPANTQAIIGTCTSVNIAARRCSDLIINGYDDWFLPSRMELQLMYQNLNLAAASFNTISAYWSSTQNNNISAQAVSFSTGNTINQNKVVDYRVRAARRF